jgi:hypothetical protein
MKISSRRAGSQSSTSGTMMSYPLLSPFGLVIRFYNNIRYNKQ